MLRPVAILNKISFLKQCGLILRSHHMRSIAPTLVRRITPASDILLI